jgi:predicted RNA binding protein YcfA (HicA-like mRNA interferase family)
MGRRITPLHYRKLVKIFELDGWVVDRQKGSHIILKKNGFVRRVVIPCRKSVPVYVIQNDIRTAKLTRERYFELLNKV